MNGSLERTLISLVIPQRIVSFYYAEINGNTHIEYDHKPDRAEIEEDYLNIMAERDIDRHEAEVFARFDGSDDSLEQPLVAEAVQDTFGHDVQKGKTQIDKSNAVNFRIMDDTLGIGGAKEKFRRNVGSNPYAGADRK